MADKIKKSAFSFCKEMDYVIIQDSGNAKNGTVGDRKGHNNRPKMMTDREKIIEDLKSFCKTCDGITDVICEKLSWSKGSLLSEPVELVSCHYDIGHRVPVKSLERHKEQCYLTHRGLSKQDAANIVPSSSFCYENARNIYSTTTDKDTQKTILRKFQNDMDIESEKEVPVCGDHSLVELTPQERLALYEHVISCAKNAGKPVTEITDELLFDDLMKNKQNDGQPQSLKEQLAAQRDFKRRRQTYRAKNVHITRKSYTEIMRELIVNQTEMLRKTIEENRKESTPDRGQGDETTKPRSRSRSHSRSKSDRGQGSKRYRSRSRSASRSKRGHSRKVSRSRSKSPSTVKESTSDRGSNDGSARSHKHHKKHKKHKHKHHKSDK